jgi:hypothetical protein
VPYRQDLLSNTPVVEAGDTRIDTGQPVTPQRQNQTHEARSHSKIAKDRG